MIRRLDAFIPCSKRPENDNWGNPKPWMKWTPCPCLFLSWRIVLVFCVFFWGGAVELVNGLIHRNENFLRLKLMEQGCNKTTLLCWKFMTDYLKSKIGVGGIKIPWSTKQKYRKVRSPPSLLKTFLAHMCQDAHPPRIGRDHARADIWSFQQRYGYGRLWGD